VKLEILPGAGHMGPAFQTASSQALVDRFLDARLRGCR